MIDPSSQQVVPDTASRRRLAWLSLGAKVLVTFVVFALVLWNIELKSLVAAFGTINRNWLAVGLGFLLMHFLLMVWRWDLVLRRLYGQRIRFGRLCYIYGLGETIGTFLPSFIGMDLVRTAVLAATAPLRLVVQSVLVDRVLGIVSLLVLIVCTLPFVIVDHGFGPIFWGLSAISFGGLIGYVVLLTSTSWLGWVPWIGHFLKTVTEVLRTASIHHGVAPIVVGSGLVMQFLSVGIFWASIRMLGAPVSLLDCLVIVPTGFLVASVPLSLAGWGVREGAMVVGFQLLGIDGETVVAASVCYGLSGLVSGGIGMVASSLMPSAAARSSLDSSK